jgi:hypothetical protein
MDNMRHDARRCRLCNLDDGDRLFAGQLFLWSEPLLNIDEEFGLPVGCADTHFGTIEGGAFAKRRENLERAPQWPLFENTAALFVETDSTGISTRLRRLAARLDKLQDADEDSDDFRKVVSATAKFFANDSLADLTATGQSWFERYATLGNVARAYVASLDFSAMQPAEERQLFGAVQKYLPNEKLRVPEKIRRYGNAAVAVGMICDSAMRADHGIDFSGQGLERYLEIQVGRWISFRLLSKWFVPMFQGSKPSHRDFFILSLQSLIEDAKEEWIGSPADTARKSLERQLRKVIRPPKIKRAPIKSMEQLMSRNNNLGIREENPALYQHLCEEIPVGIASMLYKQRKSIRNADELIEAWQDGRMGLVWNETHDRLVDTIRKENKNEAPLALPLLVELEEVPGRGPNEQVDSSTSAEVLVQEQLLRKLIVAVLEDGDELDRLIALRILEFRIYRSKKPKNSELAREWKDKTGNSITGQAIGPRRNKVELQISRLMLDPKFRKAIRL